MGCRWSEVGDGCSGTVLIWCVALRWCMARLEGMVLAGERQCREFAEVVALVTDWEGDRVGTQAHVLVRQQLVVLKIRSHQDGVAIPSGCTVAANELADECAGEGASKDAVIDVISPSVGARFTISVGGVGVSGYVSQSVKRFGLDQADMRLSQLRQQGAPAVLNELVGGDFRYYVPESGVWVVPEVCQFRAMMFGDRYNGYGDKMQGQVVHGIGGTVRAHVRYREVSRMMKAIGRARGAWGGFIEGEAQVCESMYVVPGKAVL